MALYGGSVFGPAATVWYSFLSRRITLGNNPNGLSTILSRVALDQLVFTPINLTCFLSSMAFLENSSPQQRLSSTFWNALERNWMVWPAVQLANFKLVPAEHRVLLVNVVALGWNCYLSHLNSHC
jgi:protein Mpv17